MIKVEKIGDPKESVALGHAAGKEIKDIAGPVKFAEYGAAVADVHAAAGSTCPPSHVPPHMSPPHMSPPHMSPPHMSLPHMSPPHMFS